MNTIKVIYLIFKLSLKMIGKFASVVATAIALLSNVTMAGEGTSETDSMDYIIPVGDTGLINLSVWNEVDGEYKEDQKWTLHLKFDATYQKATDGRSYEAGMCFPMFEPFGNMVDCFTIVSGLDPIDNIVNTDLQDLTMNSDYPSDEVSQSWDLVARDGQTKPTETCTDGVCTLSV